MTKDTAKRGKQPNELAVTWGALHWVVLAVVAVIGSAAGAGATVAVDRSQIATNSRRLDALEGRQANVERGLAILVCKVGTADECREYVRAIGGSRP